MSTLVEGVETLDKEDDAMLDEDDEEDSQWFNNTAEEEHIHGMINVLGLLRALAQ